MTYTAADVDAARVYLAGLSDERAVQLHRWLDKRNGQLPDETEGQMPLPEVARVPPC